MIESARFKVVSQRRAPRVAKQNPAAVVIHTLVPPTEFFDADEDWVKLLEGLKGLAQNKGKPIRDTIRSAIQACGHEHIRKHLQHALSVYKGNAAGKTQKLAIAVLHSVLKRPGGGGGGGGKVPAGFVPPYAVISAGVVAGAGVGGGSPQDFVGTQYGESQLVPLAPNEENELSTDYEDDDANIDTNMQDWREQQQRKRKRRRTQRQQQAQQQVVGCGTLLTTIPMSGLTALNSLVAVASCQQPMNTPVVCEQPFNTSVTQELLQARPAIHLSEASPYEQRGAGACFDALLVKSCGAGYTAYAQQGYPAYTQQPPALELQGAQPVLLKQEEQTWEVPPPTIPVRLSTTSC
jgi:hypothetical protein